MATEIERHPWRTRQMKELVEAMWSLEEPRELEDFLRDLCTLSELEAMAHRWEVAQLLHEGLPYAEVARRTGASTTTVTRVAQWLKHGQGGYAVALLRMDDRQEAKRRQRQKQRAASRQKRG